MPLYNTGKFWRGLQIAEVWQKVHMTKFEEVGRKLDREVARLRDLAEKKIKPETRLKAARSLRSVAQALSRVAADLEAKIEAPSHEKPPHQKEGE